MMPAVRHARAERLFNLDFEITPLCPGSKAPRLKNWQHRVVIPQDFRPDDGVGIVTGPQPNGRYLIVLDFDHKPERGIDATVEIQRFLDAAPASLMARVPISRSTSGTGYHVWMYVNEPMPKHPLYNADGERVGCFLGCGAQVVAPQPHQFIYDSLAAIPTLTAAELDALRPLIDRCPPAPDPLPITAPLAAYSRDVATGTLRPGDDYNARGDVLGLLKAHGWTVARYEGQKILLRRPGKRHGHSASFNSPGYANHLYIFSTSVTELPVDTSLSPWAVYTYLEHGGNWCAAAKALADQGYGTPRTPKDNGRPHVLTANVLLAYYEEQAGGSAVLRTTQVETARHFGVSVRTVVRLDGELQERGLAVRKIYTPGQPSFIELNVDDRARDKTPTVNTYTYTREDGGGFVTCSNSVPAERIDDELAGDEKAVGESGSAAQVLAEQEAQPQIRQESETSNAPRDEPGTERPDAHRQGPSPTGPSGARPDQRDETPQVTLDQAIIAVIGSERPSLSKVHAGLAHYFTGHAWSDAAIAARYEEVMRRRRSERQVAQLATLPQGKLTRLDRWCSRLITDGPGGPDGKQYYMAAWLAPHIAQEFERRAPMLARVKPEKARKKMRALPLLEGS